MWVFGVSFTLAFIVVFFTPDSRKTGEEKEDVILTADIEEESNN